jgi:uncharacterized integral membrane protein
MNIRAFSLSLILAFVLLAAFAALNWVALATTSTLNFGFAELTAPLGVIMLVFTAAISGLFIIYIVLLQAGVILEERRLTKALKAQSELADTAETSRYTELRSLLEVELRKIEAQRDFTRNEFNTRMEASEQSMLKNLAEATASLSANLGEIEDKLDRVLATGASGMQPLAAR